MPDLEINKTIILPISKEEFPNPAFMPVGVRNDIMPFLEQYSPAIAGTKIMEHCVPLLFGITKEDYRAMRIADAVVLENRITELINEGNPPSIEGYISGLGVFNPPKQ